MTIFANPSILTIATAIVVSLLVYKFIVYPVFISPLAKVPSAHPTAAVSCVWILWQKWHDQRNAAVHAAHERLGPIVRLGANELSLNCVDGGIRTIYAGGYEKGHWYSIFANYGVANAFSTAQHGPHSTRKRMLSNVYAKSTLQASASLAAMSEVLLCHRLLPLLEASKEQPLEVYHLFSAAGLDFVTAYVFGLRNSADLVRRPALARERLEKFKSRQPYYFWNQETPILTSILTSLGLSRLISPAWLAQADKDMDDWLLGFVDRTEEGLRESTELEPADVPVVYQQLRASLQKYKDNMKEADISDPERKPASISHEPPLSAERRMTIASELDDQVLAGFDTTGITLTYLAWELSKPENKKVQDMLQAELRILQPHFRVSNDDREKVALPDSKMVDGLPVLHAVIMETLRLHAAIPGEQPRETPANATLGPPGQAVHGIPAGVYVSSQAYSLHRKPDVFPEAESWEPKRWLDSEADEGGEKARWFWAFGSGGRMCTGKNLAMIEMKSIVAATWSNFSTSIADDSGMVHLDGYISGPVGCDGRYLLLRFQPMSVASGTK